MKNVLVVDDHLITAEGVASIVREQNGLRLVKVCCSTKGAIKFTDNYQENINVVLIDLYMPNEPTGYGIQALRSRLVDTKIICLTAADGFHDSKLAYKKGANVVFHKSTNIQKVMNACLTDANSEEITLKEDAHAIKLFTSRQVDIIKRLSEGESDKEIGVRLGISPETVRTHIKKMFHTTETNSRQKLTNWVRDNGYQY